MRNGASAGGISERGGRRHRHRCVVLIGRCWPRRRWPRRRRPRGPVSPTSKTITYGQGVILNGTLKSNGAGVSGLWVDFAQATTSGGSYTVMYKVTAPEGPYATGTYSIAGDARCRPRTIASSGPGDADYVASNSDVVPVQVKPSLGKPSCPSSVKSGKKFTVKGTVKPGQGVGPAVKIKAYRRNGSGAYTVYKTYSATVSGTPVQGDRQDQQDRQVQVQGDHVGERAVRGQRVSSRAAWSPSRSRQIARAERAGGQPRGCPPARSASPSTPRFLFHPALPIGCGQVSSLGQASQAEAADDADFWARRIRWRTRGSGVRGPAWPW